MKGLQEGTKNGERGVKPLASALTDDQALIQLGLNLRAVLTGNMPSKGSANVRRGLQSRKT